MSKHTDTARLHVCFRLTEAAAPAAACLSDSAGATIASHVDTAGLARSAANPLAQGAPSRPPRVPSSYLADLLFVALCFLGLWAVFAHILPDRAIVHRPPMGAESVGAARYSLVEPTREDPREASGCHGAASEFALQSLWQTSFIAEPYHV